MARPDKVSAVAEIADSFRNSSAAVVTEYTGLSVSQLSELRRSLGAGNKYRVAKNTLVKIAAEDAGVEGIDDLFVGPTAIAFFGDELAEAAKALKAFAKDNEKLVIKGGYLDGAVLSKDDVLKLADLPTREEMLTKLAGAFKAQLSATAGLLNAPATQVARLTAAPGQKAAGLFAALEAKRNAEAA